MFSFLLKLFLLLALSTSGGSEFVTFFFVTHFIFSTRDYRFSVSSDNRSAKIQAVVRALAELAASCGNVRSADAPFGRRP